VLTLTRRDTRRREAVPEDSLVARLASLEKEILAELSRRAWEWLNSNVHEAPTRAELVSLTKGAGGFIKFTFCGREECAAEIKARTGGYEVRGRRADIEEEHAATCTWCGEKGTELAYLAKAY
jgi:prolyl-tRNA synthetase